MTKEELKSLVDRVHANWNIQPLPAQLQTIYKAWFTLLEPFTIELADSIITQLAKEDSWAPRPGTVYNRCKDALDPNPPPNVHYAWEQYRSLAAQLDTGVWQETDMHPVLRNTINIIGGYHLHTNADREHFTQIYLKQLNENT